MSCSFFRREEVTKNEQKNKNHKILKIQLRTTRIMDNNDISYFITEKF